MADNTTIVYVNVAGGAHHQGFDDVPFVVVGGLGVLRMGRHVELPLGLRGSRARPDVAAAALRRTPHANA